MRNVKHGYGVYRWASGNTYVGQWAENRREGKIGELHWANGDKYSGEVMTAEVSERRFFVLIFSLAVARQSTHGRRCAQMVASAWRRRLATFFFCPA